MIVPSNAKKIRYLFIFLFRLVIYQNQINNTDSQSKPLSSPSPNQKENYLYHNYQKILSQSISKLRAKVKVLWYIFFWLITLHCFKRSINTLLPRISCSWIFDKIYFWSRDDKERSCEFTKNLKWSVSFIITLAFNL